MILKQKMSFWPIEFASFLILLLEQAYFPSVGATVVVFTSFREEEKDIKWAKVKKTGREQDVDKGEKKNK